MRATFVALVSGVATWRLFVRRPFPWREPRRDPLRSSGGALPAGGRPERARPRGRRVPEARRCSSRRRSPAVDRRDDHAASIDLLAVTIGAGSTVPMAVQAVGDSGDGPTASALRRVSAAVQRGSGFLDALDELDRSLGASGRELRVPLASAVTTGAPVGPSLQRLADQHRRRRRRAVEQRIRRLPVLLLLPLCGLVLPAFVVMTLVPVGVATLDDLHLPDIEDPGTP